MATVIEIVKQHLEESGFDGLVNSDTECGCHLGDFHICGGEFHECEAAYKHTLPNGDWWMHPDKDWVPNATELTGAEGVRVE